MIDFTKAKKLALLNLLWMHQTGDLAARDVEKARIYIKSYWPRLERHHPKDDGNLVGVPKPYLVPSFAEEHEFDYNELYYWDSYFMIQGMLDDDHRELVMGTIKQLREDNLIEEVPFTGNERRRYYRLTKKGWDHLGTEMKYYEQIVKLAQERRILGLSFGAFQWLS